MDALVPFKILVTIQGLPGSCAIGRYNIDPLPEWFDISDLVRWYFKKKKKRMWWQQNVRKGVVLKKILY